MLQVPIAGSGIFGPETCLARARPSGRTENDTYAALDTTALEHFTANAGSYHVQVLAIGGATFDLMTWLRGLETGRALVTNTEYDRIFALEVRPRVTPHGGTGFRPESD